MKEDATCTSCGKTYDAFAHVPTQCPSCGSIEFPCNTLCAVNCDYESSPSRCRRFPFEEEIYIFEIDTGITFAVYHSTLSRFLIESGYVMIRKQFAANLKRVERAVCEFNQGASEKHKAALMRFARLEGLIVFQVDTHSMCTVSRWDVRSIS